ncbi:MAG: DUF1573 domain-containing protein [Paludibacter sp.]
MKKYSFLLVCLVLSLTAMAQKPVINFKVTNHDFGKINESAGPATFIFDFTNTGKATLVINRVQASCGCTTPSYTKEPVEAGKKGEITVTYNPAGRPGAFTKTITVYSNDSTEQKVLIIKGEVIPKPAVAAVNKQ